MNYLMLFVILFLLFLSYVCERAERKSKKWGYDRMLLRVSGYCVGLAVALIIMVLTK